MPAAIAIAAHPDDIEFFMAGTLLLLRQSGWDIHCFNLSTGNLGSMTMTPERTAQVRRGEAQEAARTLGATWHPPIAHDLQIFYDDRSIRRVGAVIRQVRPAVILTHSPQDYMEDHMNTSRLAVSAAFAREMRGHRTVPPREPAPGPVTIYHASPHGLRDGLRRPVTAGAFVDTTSVQATKRAALECHRSQRTFLDATQAMDDYVRTMDDFSRALGKLSRKFRHAEAWRRRLHFGFCEAGADPLRDALGRKYLVNPAFEKERA